MKVSRNKLIFTMFCFIVCFAYWFFSTTSGIAIIYEGILFQKFCSLLLLICYFVITFRVLTSQFERVMNETWGTVSMNQLLMWFEWNIVIGLLIEPEIFSPYGGTFDTFWFSFSSWLWTCDETWESPLSISS